MKLKIFLVLLLLCSPVYLNAQYLSSWQFIKTYNAAQIDSMYAANGIPSFLFPKRFDVAIYKIVYNTVSYDSSVSIASGALVIPVAPDCRMPLVSYHHGTEIQKANVPSNLLSELPVGVSLASDGFAVSMPDYLGLGDSPVSIHPFLHSQSEATASIDMMRASRELIDSLGYDLNGQVFLAGYSQGGHVTLATQRMIESLFTSEFNIAGALPMSGPYDLSGVQSQIITANTVYNFPVYLPFVIFSYNQVYNFWVDYNDVYVSPYNTTLPNYFNGQFATFFVNSQLPNIPAIMLQQALIDSFDNNPNHFFRMALQENNLLDWTPVAPTKIMYCAADEQVFAQNSINAYNSFVLNGSTAVQLINVAPTLGHAACANAAFLNGKVWFDSLRTDYIKTTYQVVSESGSGMQDGQITLLVTGGLPPYSYTWSNGASTSTLSSIATGIYVYTVTDSQGCVKTDSIWVGILNTLSETNNSRGIIIFPNPASGVLNVKLPNHPGIPVVAGIYNSAGKMHVLTSIEKEFNSINISMLTPGIYFLMLHNSDTSARYKIAVMKD